MLVGLILMQFTVFNSAIQIGDLLVLAATFLWAVENTIAKRVMDKKESNWVVTFSRMFFGSLVLFALIVILGKSELFLTLSLRQIWYIVISGTLLLLYVLTWYWGLKYINLSKAASILLIAPVISLLLGIMWLDEKVFLLQIIGSALILVGGIIIARLKSEKRIREI
jgi:drug/metabolite transporter (DMT)-like permease